ncbi:MAG: ComEA family DNA-binding protein [Polyangiales bacterium]
MLVVADVADGGGRRHDHVAKGRETGMGVTRRLLRRFGAARWLRSHAGVHVMSAFRPFPVPCFRPVWLLGTALLSAAASPAMVRAADTPASCHCAPTSDVRLDINQATATEFQQLPGVGPKRAAAIVRLRQRRKGFRRISELLRVKGIGRKTLRRLKPLLVLGPRPPTSTLPGNKRP